jgi:hypothetical protein
MAISSLNINVDDFCWQRYSKVKVYQTNPRIELCQNTQTEVQYIPREQLHCEAEICLEDMENVSKQMGTFSAPLLMHVHKL